MPEKNPFRLGILEFQDPILLCFLLYLLLMRDYSGFLRISLLASFAHECGHVLIYCLFARRLPNIRVSATGFCMKTQEGCFSQHKLCLLALAGPCANFLLAGLCLWRLEYRFTLNGAAFLSANILLGLFNLLPIPPLDGAVVLQFVKSVSEEKLHFVRK